MRTYDVTLSNRQQVIFPSRCVVCEKKDPDAFIELSFLGIRTSAPLLTAAADAALPGNLDPKYYSSNTSNQIQGIPACGTCSSGLKWYHRRLQIGYYTAWIPGIVPLMLGVPMIFSIPFLLLCASAPGILTLLFPPSFGASFWNENANFEFKSETVAKEFDELNAGANSEINDQN